jgi:hypothetical protein
MKTNEYAPCSFGSTRIAASSSRCSGISIAMIEATRSESVVAAPTPTSRARSLVLTRFPLWPSATECTPSVLNTGWAFSQVLEPVVE